MLPIELYDKIIDYLQYNELMKIKLVSNKLNNIVNSNQKYIKFKITLEKIFKTPIDDNIKDITDILLKCTSRRNHESKKERIIQVKKCLFHCYNNRENINRYVLHKQGLVWCYIIKVLIEKNIFDIYISRNHITYLENSYMLLIDELDYYSIFVIENKIYHFLCYFDLQYDYDHAFYLQKIVDKYKNCNDLCLSDYEYLIKHDNEDYEDYVFECQMLNYLCNNNLYVKKHIYPKIAEKYCVKYINDVDNVDYVCTETEDCSYLDIYNVIYLSYCEYYF